MLIRSFTVWLLTFTIYKRVFYNQHEAAVYLGKRGCGGADDLCNERVEGGPDKLTV